ncbi:MAG: hypothetical protein WCP81_02900 [Actinomycetes bacterium]|jgi:hypothetical protein
MTQSPLSGDDISKAISTAQKWLRTQAPHLAPVDEQGETCPCPLCKVVVTVRDIDPDAAAMWVNTAFAAFTSTLASYTSGSSAAQNDGDWAGNSPAQPPTIGEDLRNAEREEGPEVATT